MSGLPYRAPPPAQKLDRVAASLSRADANHLLDRQDEDLPVADPPRLCCLLDRFHHVRHLLVAHDDLEFHLRQEIDDVLGPPVKLGVPLLPSEALHFAHGDALHADGGEALLHLVELEGFDDRLDLLHGCLRAPGMRVTRLCHAVVPCKDRRLHSAALAASVAGCSIDRAANALCRTARSRPPRTRTPPRPASWGRAPPTPPRRLRVARPSRPRGLPGPPA